MKKKIFLYFTIIACFFLLGNIEEDSLKGSSLEVQETPPFELPPNPPEMILPDLIISRIDFEPVLNNIVEFRFWVKNIGSSEFNGFAGIECGIIYPSGESISFFPLFEEYSIDFDEEVLARTCQFNLTEQGTYFVSGEIGSNQQESEISNNFSLSSFIVE